MFVLSHLDLFSCIFPSKTFYIIFNFPDVLQKLNLSRTFPLLWEKVPDNSQPLYECAEYEYLYAIFLFDLIDYYFSEETMIRSIKVKVNGRVKHCEAIVLISENQLIQEYNYIKKLQKEKGFGTV